MLNVSVIKVVRVSCDTLIYPTNLPLLLRIACFNFILVVRAIASKNGFVFIGCSSRRGSEIHIRKWDAMIDPKIRY